MPQPAVPSSCHLLLNITPMQNRQAKRRVTALLLAACLSAGSTGCTLLALNEMSFTKKEAKFQTPRQMVPVWSDTVLHQPGEAATRGFGGRVMFYGEDKHKPILVEGTLVVYAWDDSKGSMERAPDRKYVFPTEKLQTHYSQSRLGHSYSFWVPWDEAGGPLQQLTLISRFVSTEGTEMTSSPAHVVLQGASPSSPFPNESPTGEVDVNENEFTKRIRNRAAGGIQQVGYETTDDEQPENSHMPAARISSSATSTRKKHPGLKTAEIDLTSGFYHRNMQNSGQQSPNTTHSSTVTDADELLNTADASSTPAEQSDEKPGAKAEAKGPQSAGFPPFESRVRASRAARSSGDHVRKEPIRAKWLNSLPETPRSSANAPE